MLLLPRLSRRRALQGSAAALVVFGLLLWWLLPLGESTPGGKIVFSTGIKGGVYEKYGKLLRGAAANDLPDLDIELLTSDGSKQNVARVANGGADFTIAAADAVQRYRDDRSPGYQSLRGCARLYDDYVHLIVPADSKVREAKDLRGKRVSIGPADSGVRLISEAVLEAAGLTKADITPVSSTIREAPKQLKNDEIDAFFWSGGLTTDNVTDLTRRFPVRLVPLGDRLLKELHRQGGGSSHYRAAVVPSDAYPEAKNDGPVQTLAVANLLVTTDDADPELTESLTRTVIDHRDSIGSKVHAAQLVDLRTAIYTNPLPLHDGASRYYRSVKP
ncbi:TAXI family TRAP transporter solute-binding subunit [Streptomyces sp. NBC_01304]|uniref:TAXI family TRAP transporter solute-binding subunit n=1 Tax=Streptomyces sp. NBC_01304 TaxID=2903818 RepID=UPI002E14E20B|nr:TAXI family TRAP transporter solute-binding subunit [Streptomyces sp. NBC_01304]